MATTPSNRRKGREFCKSSPRAACPSRKELRASILLQAFEVYDANKSGSIECDELRKLLHDLGWPCNDEFLKRTVDVLDGDQSGAINFGEFLNWTEFAYASRVLYPDDMTDDNWRRPFDESVVRGDSYRPKKQSMDFPRTKLSVVLEEGHEDLMGKSFGIGERNEGNEEGLRGRNMRGETSCSGDGYGK